MLTTPLRDLKPKFFEIFFLDGAGIGLLFKEGL